MIHHIPIPLLHASLKVSGGNADHMIGFGQDIPVDDPILGGPAVRLSGAGQGQKQPGVRMGPPEPKDCLGGQKIKTQGRAGKEKTETTRPRFLQSVVQSSGEGGDILILDQAVAGKAKAPFPIVKRFRKGSGSAGFRAWTKGRGLPQRQARVGSGKT